MLIAGTVYFGVSAEEVMTNEIQSETTTETTIETHLLGLPDPATDTQVSTSTTETVSFISDTSADKTTTIVDTTTVLASTNSGTNVSVGTNSTTFASTSTTKLTAYCGTTVSSRPIPHQSRPIVVSDKNGIVIIYPNGSIETKNSARQTTTTTSTIKSTTATNLQGAPRTGSTVNIETCLAILGAAAIAGIMTILEKKSR